eukprot:193780_1
MNSLTETQQYFAQVAIKLLQEITPKDILLHQQVFEFDQVFEISPFLTGPFNKVSTNGKSSIIESLVHHKIIRNVTNNLYKFTTSNITNEIHEILQNNPINVKNKFMDKFSFAKYIISEKNDDRYKCINICFTSSDNDNINTTMCLLTYSLFNGTAVQLFVLEIPAYNQNSNDETARACGSLGVVLVQPYIQNMDAIDPIVSRIIILLHSLSRVKCNVHSNCEHISNPSQLLPLLHLLEQQLKNCVNVEYIENELEKCKEYLNNSGFDLWDQSNSLSQISSEMIQCLIDKYSEDDDHEQPQIALVNNPTQIQLSLEQGVMHEEYEIVQNASKHLATYYCTNSLIAQTCNDAVTSEHFKTINLYLPQSHDYKEDDHDEPSICSLVLDFDSLKQPRVVTPIFTLSSLILNVPFLNKSILHYRGILFDVEVILMKLISDYEEYDICMAWEIRECLKKIASHWPRYSDSLLDLEFETTEVKIWLIEELEKLDINVETNNINENNWKDFILNVDIDDVVKYKVLEVAQRSQWVALMIVWKRLNDDESHTQITIEQIRKQTLQMKTRISSVLNKIQKKLKHSVPDSVKKKCLEQVQALQTIVTEYLYDEVAMQQDQ